MTHEIKNLVKHVWEGQQQGLQSILATVVALEGSSYRRPGVRMLIQDNGNTIGAVSGGCVEKEVQRQAQSVFESGVPKVMTYDGRLRLGCEGVIFILLEPIRLTPALQSKFEAVFQNRMTFESTTFYEPAPQENKSFGTQFFFEGVPHALRNSFSTPQENLQSFKQTFPPLFQLYLFGAEHDAVVLCKAAAALGWEVTVIAPPDESKTKQFFEGAEAFVTPTFEALDLSRIDTQTAVLLMTHSFSKDVQYLLALAKTQPAYLGILGPKHRRERVIEQLLNFDPEVSLSFLETLHGPSGINIGAESAEEIAVSILAEILSVIRNQKPVQLKEKTRSIHD